MRHSSIDNAQSLLPTSTKRHANLSLLLSASAAFVLVHASNASANPTGADVVSGSATISNPATNKLVVNQTSDKAIINWKNFDISENEWTQFVQPGSNSVALNRITDGNPTEILGKLTANGKIMVVNPNGVFFGANSTVDVAGLIASTSDTSNADFLAGKTNLSVAGKPDASIVNKGHITAADGGLVALVAPNVRNDGIIQANLGTVALASAQTASIDMYGDNLYSFALDKETTAAATGAKAAVENNGIISVGGGKVLLTAKVAKGVVDNVINNTGIIEANSAHMEGGTVVLDGGEGNVNLSGKISATGKTGGKVTVTGSNIQLANADVNASGTNGGGSVKIGGDYQGKGSIQHAKTVTVDAASKIDVSATDKGNGGTAVIWSDEVTDFNGSIKGTGGVNGGNGGLAEVSSKGELGYNGAADLHAYNGDAGTLLLDPNSLYIGTWGDHFIGTDHFVNYAPIVTTLDGGTNVISTAINNVTVLADLIWSGSGSYTIDAGHDVHIEADIKSSFSGTNTQGAITVNAGNGIYMGTADVATNKGDINTSSVIMSMSGSTLKSNANVNINNSGKFSSSTANVIEGKSVTLHQSQDGSIQNAINAVGPTGTGGALLQLGDGTWVENVDINQGNFTLKGNGSGNSFIQATSPTAHVVKVGSGINKVTVSDLAVSGGEVGIDVSNNSNFKLQNAAVNYSSTGLNLDSTTSASVSDSSFYGNFVGISGSDTNFTNIKNNSLYNNFIAMDFDGDTNLTIKDNYFESNFTGIGLNNVVGAPITGNEMYYTTYGIYATGGKSLVINDNNMYYVDYGITGIDSLGISINRNYLYGGFGGGECDCEEVSLTAFSKFGGGYGIGSYGIHVTGGLNSAITRNTVDNFYTGIGVENSTNNTVTRNTVQNIVDDGIYLNSNANTYAFGNSVNNATTGIHAVGNSNTDIESNEVSDTDTGVLVENNGQTYILSNNLHDNNYGSKVYNTNNIIHTNNTYTDNGTGASFFNSNNAILTGDIFTGNNLGINLDNSQDTKIYEATVTSSAGQNGILIANGSGGTLVRGLNITGGDVGITLDGKGSSMQFESDTSVFTGQGKYFVLQNNAMFNGGSTAQADSLDASQQTFDGTRASDFTEAQLAAAEFITTDVEDGIPTIGNVFYKVFPSTFALAGTDSLLQFQEFPFTPGLFSYAGRTITNDPSVTPPAFDVPSLNLSLLSPGTPGTTTTFNPSQLGSLAPAAGGNNPQALGSLEPSAGGNNNGAAFASLEPSAGGVANQNCGNNFLGSGFSNKFDNASCSVQQQ